MMMLNLSQMKSGLYLAYAFLLELWHRLSQSIVGDNLSFLRGPFWLPPEKGNILITGGDSGVGKAQAIYLAKLGYKVIITGHNQEKALSALEEIRSKSGNAHVELYLIDMTSLSSVRSFAQSIRERGLPIHVLVNNAGGIYQDYVISGDGMELTFQVNHAAPFLLTHLLLDNLLKASPPARIITIGSLTHLAGRANLEELQRPRPPYQALAYNDSKLCVMLFARELQQKLNALGRPDILSLIAYPGGTSTDFGENLGALFRLGKRLVLKSPESGARTQIYLTLAPASRLVPGVFYMDTKDNGPMSHDVRDRRLAQSLWDYTAKLVGI